MEEKYDAIEFEAFSTALAEKLLSTPANIINLRETLLCNMDILMTNKMKTTFKNADLLLVCIFAHIKELIGINFPLSCRIGPPRHFFPQ